MTSVFPEREPAVLLLSRNVPARFKALPSDNSAAMLGALVRLVVGQIRSRASLVEENELLRQQLAAAKERATGKR